MNTARFFHLFDFELAQSGADLGPAEDFLEASSALQADLVAWMARGAAVDCAFVPCASFIDAAVDSDMRGHLAGAQFTDEIGNIVGFIGPSVMRLLPVRRPCMVSVAARSAVPVAGVRVLSPTRPLRFSIST